ncbi:ABC transporter permease [Umezawaea beigongshangensis]|uniref:ABC transporter permease n=1 Tax=Umezawaea beigongshangensis TaxID=2780383 RepID=UPI001E555610|nr:ABC transporter permease [Umezawaea beigongshangensis]
MIRTSGRFRSSLVIGGQGIRARKLRTFLSMISLFTGVLAVVAVQAGSVIAERALLADVELQNGVDGTRLMYLPQHDSVSGITLELLRGRSDAVAASSTSAIIGEPGVKPINPGGAPLDQPGSYGGGGSMVCDQTGCRPENDPNANAPSGQAIELQLTMLTGDVTTFKPYRPSSGQWLDFDGAPSMAPRLVLNKQAAEGFATHRVPAEMRVEGATANPTPLIVGVVDDGGYGPAAYVRIDEMANWMPPTTTGDSGRYGGMEVLLAPSAHEIEQTMRARFSAAGADVNQMYTRLVDSRSSMESQLSLMRWIFLALAAMVLLIGVAGILNVGLATVGERIEEFALRRAVGTPRLLLAGIVLAETLLTGLITAAAAIGAAVVGLHLAGAVLGSREPFLQDIVFPWQAGVAGVIAGLVAGVLGGLVPAVRAAKIPIATVMRA